jgi:hypothetical protein
MRKITLLLLGLWIFFLSPAQTIKKYPIGSSGCSAYFFCDPGNFNESFSEDSSKVYTGECISGETRYGLICVQLIQAVVNIDDAEGLLVNYLDYLKTAFKITSAMGYGKGHRLRNKENFHGIIDYWKDENQNNWKVKGWTDGKYIAVLYAFSPKELSEEKANVFLDGILIKGM